MIFFGLWWGVMAEEYHPVSSLPSRDLTKFPHCINCIKQDLDLSSYCQITSITETLKQTKVQRLHLPFCSDCKLPRLDQSHALGQVDLITVKEKKSDSEKKSTAVSKKLKKSD